MGLGSGVEYVVVRGDLNARKSWVGSAEVVVVVVREGMKVLRIPGGGQDPELQ